MTKKQMYQQKVDITLGLTTITVTGCNGAEIERIGKLMAAAPELLAACNSALLNLVPNLKSIGTHDQNIRDIEAAVRKATGDK